MDQTLRPFEIIISDDASTDGSQEAILSFAKTYPDWIRYSFQSNNVGIPKNRNAGLRMVRGNYVGVLDGDDIFARDKLEKQYETLQRVPDSKAVYGNYCLVASDGRSILGERYSSPQPDGDVLANVARGNFGILRTLVADYQMVRAAGFMDERYPKYDGFWLTLKLAASCRFAYVNSALINKREHPTSDSINSPREAFLSDLTGIHRDMQSYISALDPSVVHDLNDYWMTLLATFS
jgi:glycosyltransferase involved in cell wall biosynthesis